jgi:hypothetical protein
MTDDIDTQKITPDAPIGVAEPLTFFGTFTPEGVPTGFWNTEIFPSKDGERNSGIPPEAIEISEEAWKALIAAPDRARYIDGVVTYVDPPPIVQPLKSPLEERLDKIEATLAKLAKR